MAAHVLFVSPEIPPWVKSGGLGDVTAALPAALRRLGIDVRVLAPAYPAVLRAVGASAREVARYDAPAGTLPAARVLSVGAVNDAPLYVVDAPILFDREGGAYHGPDGADWPDAAQRFGLLSRVAALIAQYGLSDGGLSDLYRPQIIHCNDWPTGLAPAYASFAGVQDVASVMTIHNLAHQGIFGPGLLEPLGIPRSAFHLNGVEYYGNLSFLKAGLRYANRIVAVSPRYAAEIQTAESGFGMEGLLQERAADVTGIVNGIDTAVWNPATDPHLVRTYDFDSIGSKRVNKRALQEQCGLQPSDDVFLLGVVSRLTHQKGLDLLMTIADRVLALPTQLVVLGSGERPEEAAFRSLALRYPGRVSATIGFDETLAHRIEAGADTFVMPSRFEPCGLNQLYSVRYGTPPIVRATGGLADTVTDCTIRTLADGTATGFVFDAMSAEALLVAIQRAFDVWSNAASWRMLQRNGMAQDLSWDRSAREYQQLYAALGAD